MKLARALAVPVASLAFSLVAAVLAYTWADGYIDRLPNHAGYFLVPVENTLRQHPERVPSRTVVVVVDGLGHDSAAGMRVTEELATHGQCRAMSTGALTISRPVYTVLSTGTEADRTGSRNNDERTPVALQSIWEVARSSGLRVHAASDVTWWRELFPGAFSSYLHEPDTSVNIFARVELGDLTLIHPSRVDTAGHEHGAASAAYAQAVALVDDEAMAFIENLDFSQDLVVFTADHGHSASGGHGGPDLQLSRVLTCFAGPGILQSASLEAIDARVIAPTLAVLLGLPFPKHMRASQDPLDQIWTIVDENQLGTGYSAERREQIETFRRVNRETLGMWLGQETGTWSELYQRERREQLLGWLGFAALALVCMGAGFRARKLPVVRACAAVLWMGGVIALVCLLYSWVRGSLDFTSINNRQEFLNASLSVCVSMSLVGVIGHALLWRDLRELLLDQAMFVALVLAIGMAHRMIYGVPLGFPLPGAFEIFLPFLHGALVISLGLCAGLIALVRIGVLLRRRQA